MASTVFVDGVSVIYSAWLNDANSATYANFGDGTNYTGNLTVGSSKMTVAAASGNTVIGGSLVVDKGSTGVAATFGHTLLGYITENGSAAGFMHANAIATGTGISFTATTSTLQIAGSAAAIASGTGLRIVGVVNTDDPAGGTGPNWKLGIAAAVSPTSPNRTVRIDIAGTSYYLAAKLTND